MINLLSGILWLLASRCVAAGPPERCRDTRGSSYSPQQHRCVGPTQSFPGGGNDQPGTCRACGQPRSLPVPNTTLPPAGQCAVFFHPWTFKFYLLVYTNCTKRGFIVLFVCAFDKFSPSTALSSSPPPFKANLSGFHCPISILVYEVLGLCSSPHHPLLSPSSSLWFPFPNSPCCTRMSFFSFSLV